MNKEVDNEVIALPDDYFGGCPKCGRWDEHLNVGAAHWHVCYRHRAKCCWGANLVSSWRGQSPSEWEANAAKLAGFTEVRPAYPAIPPDVAAALARLLEARAGPGAASAEAAGGQAGPFTDAEVADIVRDWLELRQRDWVQFVRPVDDREPTDGEADRA